MFVEAPGQLPSLPSPKCFRAYASLTLNVNGVRGRILLVVVDKATQRLVIILVRYDMFQCGLPFVARTFAGFCYGVDAVHERVGRPARRPVSVPPLPRPGHVGVWAAHVGTAVDCHSFTGVVELRCPYRYDTHRNLSGGS